MGKNASRRAKPLLPIAHYYVRAFSISTYLTYLLRPSHGVFYERRSRFLCRCRSGVHGTAFRSR